MRRNERSRVQAVSNEIGNERIDIFVHSDNPAEFVVNCLSPVKIYSILVMKEPAHSFLKSKKKIKRKLLVRMVKI